LNSIRKSVKKGLVMNNLTMVSDRTWEVSSEVVYVLNMREARRAREIVQWVKQS
jgi:hypothetical protein